MGCDIHCYLEYKPKDSDRWRPHGGRINPGRNYEMFAVMADVRNSGSAIQPFASLEGFHVASLDDSHTDDYPWLRVFNDAGLLVNTFQRRGWLFGQCLPEPVRQFVESYAALLR